MTEYPRGKNKAVCRGSRKTACRGMALFLLFGAIVTCLFALGGCEMGRDLEEKSREEYKKYESLLPAALPTLRLTTDGGMAVDSREEYRMMTLTVEGQRADLTESAAGPPEGAAGSVRTMRGKIRGRGNSSWDMLEKKSYRLKLQKKEKLLGVGKAPDKDFVLLACGREKSMLRDYAIFLLGQRMRLSFSADSTFVHLYLNGEYEGVYHLCEQCEVGEGRVCLAKDPEGPASPLPEKEASLAFFVELDKRARSEGDFGLDYFCCNDYEIPFAVKSDTTRELTGEIEGYLEAADLAILSGDLDEIEKYIALDSFVDMYLLEEFAKDRDVGFSSLYFVKRQGGKLACTSPWDFDLALGNDTGADTGEDHKSPEGVMARRNRWFDALYRCEWFRRLLSDRLAELTPGIEQLCDEMTVAGYRLRGAAEKNYERWQVLGERLYMEPDVLGEMTDYLSHVQYLVNWMHERLAWMRGYYLMPLPGADAGPGGDMDADTGVHTSDATA